MSTTGHHSNNTYRGDTQLFIDGDTLLSREGTTQGDPLAMAMYAIGILPLINQLNPLPAKQAWFADDATAEGQIQHLHDWWTSLNHNGPSFGYHANPAKTWLIIKAEHLPSATKLFQGTGVNITTNGKRHLGAALGSRSFVESYMQDKVGQWVDIIKNLSVIDRTQPHAAYSAFIHGLSSKWIYFLCTIPDTADLLVPLDEVINTHFIPALTGCQSVCDTERQLLALPTCLGGLSLTIPSKTALFEHTSSLKVTAPLTALIVRQSPTYSIETITNQRRMKLEVRQMRRDQQNTTAEELMLELSAQQKRAMELGKEKGASSWLSALPIEDHGFALHKGDFRDALCLRYGWQPSNLPSRCACGASFTMEHALSCPTGGFPTLRHNEVRDFTANIMSEVCHDVCIEPQLQELSDEPLHHATSIRDDGAHLDMRAHGFWGDRSRRSFFNVRVFNPNAPSNWKLKLNSAYRRH